LTCGPYKWVHEQRRDIHQPMPAEGVKTMAKKDDGHAEIKKGKESER
jgi:hypothetical protein